MLTITDLRRQTQHHWIMRCDMEIQECTMDLRGKDWEWVYGWVHDLFASVLSRFACELGRFTNVLITLSDGNIS